MTTPTLSDVATPLQQALELERSGHTAQNEQLYRQVLARLAAGTPASAAAELERAVGAAPDLFPAWLLLGHSREAAGDGAGALKAYYEAVTRARRSNCWRDESSTPPPLLDAVLHAIQCLRKGRRELFWTLYDDLRQEYGPEELKRVDKALARYLRELEANPPDPLQRPRFFYFPDLPSPRYHDPFIQPWARRLQSAFPAIREEALRVMREDLALENFIELKPGERVETYLGSASGAPSWEAFFFYRHGTRFDDNHARCSQTSQALESIDLCCIADQAPEICFSVLKPDTHIRPHYGVTNVRLVMHLPLIVPSDCALHVIGEAPHVWREGELVMFDDTFQHEAWNRSPHTRIILLMDCWNPHLTPPERCAVQRLIETIGGLHLADRPRAGHSDRR